MKISKLAGIGLTALLMTVSMGARAADGGACMPGIQSAGELKVGVGIMGLKPWVWQEQDGSYHGLEKDILDFVAQDIGIPKTQYVVTEWSTLIPGLKAGRWDIVLSAMTKTQQRMQDGGVVFSDPYFMYNDRLIVLKDSKYQQPADLKGKPVASVMGSMDSLVAHDLEEKGEVGQVLDFNNFGEPFQALRNGQVQAVVLDQATLLGQMSGNTDLRVIGDPLYYVPGEEWRAAEDKADYRLGAVGIAVRPECTDLLAALNKAVAKLESTGKRKEILERYGLWDESQVKLMK
ncbi:MAG: transporter substrate-binding domain-containing protein [Castellaniella sp.]|uniref:substrate-binding periplasmic protein n=1 Tax=Castellaniella sp. TaxID=1955812 RepID=UPI003C7601C2